MILKLIIFLAICVSAVAEDYAPHIRITVPMHDRYYSGTVIGEDENDYIVLSCAHGTDGLPDDVLVRAELLGSNHSLVLPTTLVFRTMVYDLSLIKIKKRQNVKIKIIPLASSPLKEHSIGVAHGFVGVLKTVTMRNPDYETTKTKDGGVLLVLDGDVIPGMSGGGLISEGSIFGVLSGKNKMGEAFFVPISEYQEALAANRLGE